MIAYKLFRKRKDGTLGPLFINASARFLANGHWYEAGYFPTKGFATRRGFHALPGMDTTHLKKKDDRVWCEVDLDGVEVMERPVNQGGTWYLAERMRILREIW